VPDLQIDLDFVLISVTKLAGKIDYQSFRLRESHRRNHPSLQSRTHITMPISKKDRIHREQKKADAAGTRAPVKANGNPVKAAKPTSLVS
jgi:hypothetical protein